MNRKNPDECPRQKPEVALRNKDDVSEENILNIMGLGRQLIEDQKDESRR